MSLLSSIAKNTLYQTISKAISVLVGLIVIGMMTRYLGQTGFGYYTTIISFLQFFGVLADFGLQMTTTQMLSRPGIDQAKLFQNILALRLISATAFLGTAVALAWLMPYPMIIKQGISLVSLSFLAVSTQAVFISIFQNNLAMAKVAIAEIYNRLILLITTYWVITLDQGLIWVLAAFVFANLMGCLILIFSSRQYFKIRLDFDLTYWKKIFDTSWPLAITIALTLVYFRTDTLIMSFFRPQAEVGLYGAPYKVLEILIQFPYLFLGLMLPILTKFYTLNRKLFDLTLQTSFNFLIILTLPMITGVMILGQKIMILIAGPEFAVSGQLLSILIVAVGAIYLGALFGYTIVACGLQKKMIPFYIFDAVLSLALYLILIPIYTYWAAAYLTIMTEVIIMLAAFYILKKHIQMQLNYQIVYKSLIASLIMAGFIYLAINLNLFILVILGMLVYFSCLYAVKGISKQTMTEIMQIRN